MLQLKHHIVLGALAVSTLSGCAAMRAMGARHEYIRDQTESFTYDQPCSAVWPKARQLLFGKGYEVSDTDAQTAETSWQREGSYRKRYLLSSQTVEGDKCQVQFMKSEQQKDPDGGWYSPDTERDLGMEWELIQQAAPARAEKIEREADAQGEAAKTKSQ